MWESLQFVARFALQMVVAAALFALVAGVAYLLSLGTDWLHRHGFPDHLYLAAWAVTELLYGLDVLCFVIFATAEAVKLISEIIQDVRR